MTPTEFRAIRKQLGLSQVMMADLLGYSRAGTVSDIEAGRITITPMLERLMQAYEAGYLPRRDPDPSLHG